MWRNNNSFLNIRHLRCKSWWVNPEHFNKGSVSRRVPLTLRSISDGLTSRLSWAVWSPAWERARVWRTVSAPPARWDPSFGYPVWCHLNKNVEKNDTLYMDLSIFINISVTFYMTLTHYPSCWTETAVLGSDWELFSAEGACVCSGRLREDSADDGGWNISEDSGVPVHL